MDPKTVEDLQMLQGKWRQVRFEENGLIDPVDTHSAPGAVLTINGNNFHVGLLHVALKWIHLSDNEHA